MQTPSVSPVANIAATANSTGKTSEDSAPVEPFGQVLRDAEMSRAADSAEMPVTDAAPLPRISRRVQVAAEETTAKSDVNDPEHGDNDTTPAADSLVALVLNLNQPALSARPIAATISTSSPSGDVSPLLPKNIATNAQLPNTATDAQLPIQPQHASTQPPALAADALPRAHAEPGLQDGQKEIPVLKVTNPNVDSATSIHTASLLPQRPTGEPAATIMTKPLEKVAEPTLPSLPPVLPLQPAAPQMPALASELGQGKLLPTVGTPAWGQALGQKIVWMVGDGEHSASLTLNPPDLGPMQVVLHISRTETSATFTAAQPEVRHAIELALPQLREAMGNAGISLGQTSVNAGTPGQQQTPQEQMREQSRQLQAGRAQASSPPAHSAVVETGLGLINTFA